MEHPQREYGDTYRSRSERKRIIAEIQAVLQSFDKAKEWADLNNALQRLQKCISKPVLTHIPHKEIVCKRLAQCLNPHLPSGVHSRTLEVYESILQKIGTAGLIKDLALFSSGLFPFFPYSAISIRPIFLNIIDSFYIPLGKQLMPCLVGLLLCILPGLEDDKSDCFGKVHETLNRICDCVTEAHFMWALWTILLKASKIRYSTLKLIALRLEPGVPTHSDERLKILLPNRETLVLNALIASFRDECPLVMRLLSSMLVDHFPLNWQKFTKRERYALIECTLVLVNKAEWSFTRSLYKWLFNISSDYAAPLPGDHDDDDDDYKPNDDVDNNELNLEYFCKYVKSDFIEAIKGLLQIKPNTIDDVRETIKMIVSLISDIDLNGLANEVMPDLALPILKYLSCDYDEDEWRVDAISRAKMIFDPTLTPPHVIFDAIGRAFNDLVATNNLNSSRDWDELLQLMYIYIDQIISNPKHLITGLRELLIQALKSLQKISIEDDILTNILILIKEILQKIENTIKTVFDKDYSMDNVFSESTELKNSALYFLQKYYNEALEKCLATASTEINVVILDLLNNLTISMTRMSQLGWDNNNAPTWIITLAACSQSESEIFTCRATRTLIEMMKVDNRIRRVLTDSNDIYNISKHLYGMLVLNYEAYHSEIVFLLLELHELCISSPSEIEKTLMESLSDTRSVNKMDAISRFSILWKYSHIHFPNSPVFPEAVGMILDFVTDQDPHIRYHARSFLSDAVMHLPHLVDNIIVNLLPNQKNSFGMESTTEDAAKFDRLGLSLSARSNSSKKSISSVQSPSPKYAEIVVRMFKHLSSILTYEGQSTTEAMHRSVLSPNLMKAIECYKSSKMPSKIIAYSDSLTYLNAMSSMDGKSWFPQLIDVNNDSYDDDCIFDYVDLLVIIALNYICINVDISYLMQAVTVGNLKQLHTNVGDVTLAKSFLDCGVQSDNEDMLVMFRCTAIEFLKLFLSAIHPTARAKEVSCLISRPLICILLYFHLQRETVVQTQLLLLLKVVLYKSHLSGSFVSNYTKRLISTLRNKPVETDEEVCDFGLTGTPSAPPSVNKFRLWDVAFDNDENSQNILLDDEFMSGAIESIFVKVISAKERKVPNLRALGGGAIFGLILRLCTCKDPTITADLLNSHVEFSLLSMRYMSSVLFCSFVSTLMHDFCIKLKNSGQDIGIECVAIYLKGLLDLCGCVSGIILQGLNKPWGNERRTPRPSKSNSLTINSNASIFNPTRSISYNDTKLEEMSGPMEPSCFRIWDVVDSCVQCLTFFEREGDGAHFSHKQAHTQSFIRVRGAEAIEEQVISIFHLLYSKLPLYFVEGCLVTWDKCYKSKHLTDNLDNSKRVKKAMLNALNSMNIYLIDLCTHMLDMFESYCKSDNFKETSQGIHLLSCSVRESVMMDLIHELLILSSAIEIPEEAALRGKNVTDQSVAILDVMSRAASLVLRYWRQPVMAIWGLHLYLSMDKLITFRSIYLENKHMRKRLSALVLHVLLGCAKSFHKTGSSLPPAQFDLEPPLPAYLELFTCKITEARNEAPITDDEISSSSIYRLAFNCFGQLFMFCYDICHLKRTSPLAGIVLRTLCENLVAYVVPAFIKKGKKPSSGPQSFDGINNSLQSLGSVEFPINPLTTPNQWRYRHLALMLVCNLPYRVYTPCLYYMKQPIIDLLNSQGFFHTDRRTLLRLMRLLSTIVQEDIKEEKGVVKLDAYVVPYSTSVFSLKVNDAQQRCGCLKRLSFVIYSCEKDTFASLISKILERITDNIRYLELDKNTREEDEVALQTQILLAMRILLLKMSQGYLTVLWPVLLSELIKVFDRNKLKLALFCSNMASPQDELYSENEMKLLMEAVKTINVACTLRLYDFLIFQWMFVPCEAIDSEAEATGRSQHSMVDIKGVKIDKAYIEQNFMPFYTIIKYLYQRKNGVPIEATYQVSEAIALGLNDSQDQDGTNLALINKQIENDLMELDPDMVDLCPEIAVHAIYKVYHKITLRTL